MLFPSYVSNLTITDSRAELLKKLNDLDEFSSNTANFTLELPVKRTLNLVDQDFLDSSR